MRVGFIKLALVAILIVGCGGGGEAEPTPGSSGDDSQTTTTATSGAEMTTTSTSQPDDSDDSPTGAPDPGTGFVTLDGETFNFDLSTQCQVQDGSMAASGPLAGGDDGSVEGIFPAPDQQDEFGPYHVLVVFGDSDTWVAHEGYEPTIGDPPTDQESSVTDASLSGSSMTGEGYFWNTGTRESVAGSFGFTCP